MSHQIDKAAKEWLCRSNGMYGLSPSNDAVPLIQWRTMPGGSLPSVMTPELHQSIIKTMKEEIGVNCYSPTREEFRRAYSPFWTHADNCHGVLRPRADQSVLNPHFLQYFLSKTPKYATHVRHAELTNRVLLLREYRQKGLNLNPLGIRRKENWEIINQDRIRRWDYPLTEETIAQKHEDRMLPLMKNSTPLSNLRTLEARRFNVLMVRFDDSPSSNILSSWNVSC